MGYLLLFIFGLGAVLQFFKMFWKPITAAVAVPLGALGNLLAPVTGLLASPLVIVIVTAVLIVIWCVSLDMDHGPLSKPCVEATVKLLYAWTWSAFSLGMIVAVCGNPRVEWNPFMEFLFAQDMPMTLMNFAEWGGFAQAMLLLTLVGGLVVAVIFTIMQGIPALLFVLESISIFGLLGYLYMALQLALLDLLSNTMGAFIPGLISAALTLVNGVLLIQVFAGLVVFFFSPAAVNSYMETKEKVKLARQIEIIQQRYVSDDDDTYTGSHFLVPVYVTDEDGNHYPVERRGDFIFISTPQGEINTKWEYVRGQPSFDLHGKRYFPH